MRLNVLKHLFVIFKKNSENYEQKREEMKKELMEQKKKSLKNIPQKCRINHKIPKGDCLQMKEARKQINKKRG